MQQTDPYCAVYAVCKQWSDIIYYDRLTHTIAASALNEHCGLMVMQHLKSLLILSENVQVKHVAEILSKVSLPHLTEIVLKLFLFGNEMRCFVNAISQFPLLCLNCIS